MTLTIYRQKLIDEGFHRDLVAGMSDSEILDFVVMFRLPPPPKLVRLTARWMKASASPSGLLRGCNAICYIHSTMSTTTVCNCQDWGCTTCFSTPISVKPVVVENAWSTPLSITAEHAIEVESTISSTDVYWTVDKKQEVVEEWQEVKRTKDRFLTCRHCNDKFIHTIYQQKKYRERGWKNPKICKPCSFNRFNQPKK